MADDRTCEIHPLPDRVDIFVPGKRRLFRKDLPDKTITFRWNEITQAAVFKRDLFTVDCIHLIFELNGTHTLEVHEEMQGWKDLIDAIPRHLPGAMSQEQWWNKVVSPAFELCWTKIYPSPSQT
jgi:hypothetical protein